MQYLRTGVLLIEKGFFMIDIIIIGAGPAGLTAAIYARRAGKSVLVLDRENFGGQINYSPKIENYPGFTEISGTELADAFVSQALAQGADIDIEEVTGLSKSGNGFIVATDSGTHECRAVILATGAKHRHLGVPGEEELLGNGISFCATCDGAFYAGAHVIVIGGGNSAAAEALQLAETSETVTILQDMPTLTCEKSTAEKIYGADNIEVITNTKVLSFFSEGEKIGAEIADGVTGETRRITADGIFEAIGLVPDNEAFQNLVELDRGYVRADDSCTTSTPGIFTAGDCRTKAFRQITTACADGTAAALAACAFLQ